MGKVKASIKECFVGFPLPSPTRWLYNFLQIVNINYFKSMSAAFKEEQSRQDQIYKIIKFMYYGYKSIQHLMTLCLTN